MLPLAPAPDPAPALWRADGPGAFLWASWNTVGAAPPQVTGEEVSFQLTGRGQRSELEPALPAVAEGDQHDLTFSVRLDGQFAPGAGARQVIARWENDGPGRAPLELRVADGELVLHGGEGHPSGPRTFTRVLGGAPIGEWTQLRVLVRFSADPDRAAVSVWRDRRSLVDDDHPRGGTLYPGQQSYLKAGLHRDRTIAAASTVRFSAWHIDHGRAAGDPAVRGSSGPAEGKKGSARSDTSDSRPHGRSAPSESDRDLARQTIRRDTSPGHRSDREASRDGSTSERSSTASVEPGHRGSQSDTSHRRAPETSTRDGSDRDVARHTRTTHRDRSPDRTSPRQESDDDATSDHHSEPSRQHDTSRRGTSQDAGAHRDDSSRHRLSTDTDVGGGDDSGKRSGEG